MPRAEQILFESKVGSNISPSVLVPFAHLCLQINNFTLHMNRAMPTNQQRVRRFPGIFNDLDRLRHDLQGAKRLAARFEKIIEDDRASAAIASKVEQWEMEGLLSSEEIVLLLIFAFIQVG